MLNGVCGRKLDRLLCRAMGGRKGESLQGLLLTCYIVTWLQGYRATSLKREALHRWSMERWSVISDRILYLFPFIPLPAAFILPPSVFRLPSSSLRLSPAERPIHSTANLSSSFITSPAPPAEIKLAFGNSP